MRRISLAALGVLLTTLAGFSQEATDSSTYKNRKLKLEEVNFVSGYYGQDGNNSAVTGVLVRNTSRILRRLSMLRSRDTTIATESIAFPLSPESMSILQLLQIRSTRIQSHRLLLRM